MYALAYAMENVKPDVSDEVVIDVDGVKIQEPRTSPSERALRVAGRELAHQWRLMFRRATNHKHHIFTNNVYSPFTTWVSHVYLRLFLAGFESGQEEDRRLLPSSHHRITRCKPSMKVPMAPVAFIARQSLNIVVSRSVLMQST